jgi:hypothetical protein
MQPASRQQLIIVLKRLIERSKSIRAQAGAQWSQEQRDSVALLVQQCQSFPFMPACCMDENKTVSTAQKVQGCLMPEQAVYNDLCDQPSKDHGPASEHGCSSLADGHELTTPAPNVSVVRVAGTPDIKSSNPQFCSTVKCAMRLDSSTMHVCLSVRCEEGATVVSQPGWQVCACLKIGNVSVACLLAMCVCAARATALHLGGRWRAAGGGTWSHPSDATH